MRQEQLLAEVNLRVEKTHEEIVEELLARNAALIENFRHMQRALQAEGFYGLSNIVLSKDPRITAHLCPFPEDDRCVTRTPEEAVTMRVHYTAGYDENGHKVFPTMYVSESFSLVDEERAAWYREHGRPFGIESNLVNGEETLEMLKTALMDDDLNPDFAPGIRAYYSNLEQPATTTA